MSFRLFHYYCLYLLLRTQLYIVLLQYYFYIPFFVYAKLDSKDCQCIYLCTCYLHLTNPVSSLVPKFLIWSLEFSSSFSQLSNSNCHEILKFSFQDERFPATFLSIQFKLLSLSVSFLSLPLSHPPSLFSSVKSFSELFNKFLDSLFLVLFLLRKCFVIYFAHFVSKKMRRKVRIKKNIRKGVFAPSFSVFF